MKANFKNWARIEFEQYSLSCIRNFTRTQNSIEWIESNFLFNGYNNSLNPI